MQNVFYDSGGISGIGGGSGLGSYVGGGFYAGNPNAGSSYFNNGGGLYGSYNGGKKINYSCLKCVTEIGFVSLFRL